jgi:hypothetical protein
MYSSEQTGSTTQREPRRRSDHPRAKAAWKFVLWLALVVFAFAPFPWS